MGICLNQICLCSKMLGGDVMKRWKKYVVLGLSTVGILSAMSVGSYSYLTDSGKLVNDLTTADLSIDLVEPKYTSLADSNSDGVKNEATYTVQGKVIPADPKVVNDKAKSTIGMYAFIVIDIPTEKVMTVKSVPNKVSTELYKFTVTDSNWKLMETKSISGYTRRIYAYSKVVPVGSSTTPLFDGITYADVVEGEISTTAVKKIPMKGYAIQSEGFKDYKDAYDSFDWSQKEVQ